MFHSKRLAVSVRSFSKLWNLEKVPFISNASIFIHSKRNMCAKKTPSIDQTTINVSEVEKFHKLASEWWKPNSPMRGLLKMNVLRVPFVRDGLLSNVEDKKTKSGKPLEGFRIADIGCGGGFLSEALARLGANVTGVDPSSNNVGVATAHASLDPALKDNLTYVCSTVEELVGTIEPFDALVCSEVIEHVNNPDFFVECCADLVKSDGSLFFTTFDKTNTSYILGILVGEYVLGFIPKGTHDWNKFIPPSTLQKMLEHQHCRTQTVHGMLYNPITDKFSWSSSTSFQYALHAVKALDP